jgi:transposase-like protein
LARTRAQRIEVITRGEQRCRWSIEEKREIVAESLRPGVGPNEVIRKHGISSGQHYTWRQQLTCRLGGEPFAPVNFAQVDVVVARHQATTRLMADAATATESTSGAVAAPRACCAARAMINPPPGVRVYLACGYTDMRKGMTTRAMLVQKPPGDSPFSGAVYAFRGRRGKRVT